MQDSDPLTAELVVDAAAAVSPAISPDGRLVAYAVIASGGRGGCPQGSIWITAADGSAAPRRLTDGTAQDLSPKWAPDSTSVFFTSDREEQGTAQLQRIRLDGGEAETLASRRGGISDHCPLLDGRTVALLAEDEEQEAEGDDAKVWGRHLPVTRLRLLDLETGVLRTVEGLGDRHVVEVAQRPDCGPLAVLSWSTPEIDVGVVTAELQLLDPGSGAVQTLGPVGFEAQSPVWWNDNGVWHLAHLAVAPGHLVGGVAVLDTVPAATAAPTAEPVVEHRDLTAGMSVCPTELAQAADGPPARTVRPRTGHRCVPARPGVAAVPAAVLRARHTRRAHREPVWGILRPSGEHRVRARERPCRTDRGSTDPAQRHQAGTAQDPLGRPGAPRLSGF